MDKNLRILVVDDQEDLRLQIAKTLQQRGADQETISLIDQIRSRIGNGKEPVAAAPRTSYQVDTFAQGKDAYEGVKTALADNKPYAVMFLDMRMPPGWDGMETAQRIRGIDKELQIVIMTAYADYDQSEIAEKVGEPDKLLYIKKPFHPEEIRQLALALTEKWNLNRREKERMVLTNRLMRENSYLTRQPFESLETSYTSLLNAFISFLDARAGVLARRVGRDLQICAATTPEDGTALLAGLNDEQRKANRVATQDQTGAALLPIMFGSFDGLVYVTNKGVPYPYDELRPFLDILMETARGVLRNALLLASKQTPDELTLVAPTLGRLATHYDHRLAELAELGTRLQAGAPPGELTAAAERLRAATQELQQTNAKLHRFADLGTAPLNLAELRVADLLPQALATQQAALAAAKIEVETRTDTALLVAGDAALLQRALAEIIGNAIAALAADERPQTRRLTLAASVPAEPPRRVQLVIADNAHGLPGEVKGHLFEPLIAATAASEPLHGLGAALACHLVRRHRGTIECRTEADRGTTVTITLPAAGE